MSETSPAAVEKPQPPLGATVDSKADTFCIHLWNHLRLQANGEAQVCCIYKGGNISQDGSSMSLQRQSLKEIWNSEMMRSIRREMVEGRPVAGCVQCYKEEAHGGMSMRVRDNANWENGWLNEGRMRISDIKFVSANFDFNAPTLPALIEIDTGSLCNLKCRMCHDGVSSLIAKDLVHSSWTADQYSGNSYHNENSQPHNAKLRRFPPLKASLDAELSRHRGEVKRLYFIGGEPLLVREIQPLLQGLIDSGQSRDLEIAIVSNGSVVPPWLSMAAQFRRFGLAISIDGFGKHYDYIRYPARWDALTENLRLFKETPNVHLSAAVTIQINNALNITDLLRYFDATGISFYAYPISNPRYLAIDALPASVRRLAAARLRAYGEGDCLSHHREMVLANVAHLESTDAVPDMRLLRDFMLFTNDLDASREQSIQETDQELLDLLAAAGFTWTQETLHAARGRAAAASSPL
jgi:MoaA/NifB/PqqE/SkfB family radical SAM enzyme